MRNKKRRAGVRNCNALLKQAEERTERVSARAQHAETRAERAKTRAELAEMRAEEAETRTESAKTRAEHAEARAEEAEILRQQTDALLRRVIQRNVDSSPSPTTQVLNLPAPSPRNPRAKQFVDPKDPLEQLAPRRREILQLIAQGHNTKQIGEMLNISPKTVEYHRVKLMKALNVHDVAGLVRVALRAGLIPLEG